MVDTVRVLDRVAWKRGQKGEKIVLRLFLYMLQLIFISCEFFFYTG